MRNLGLDIVRFVAVLLVIGRHLTLPDPAPNWLVVAQRGGWVGVDLFFVLSGFLVSSLLFEETLRTGKANVVRFLIRRGFKIYPAFWVFIGVTVAVRSVTGFPPVDVRIMAELLFVQNYLGGLWTHTWSLAIEEHFYLLLALLVAVMVRVPKPDRKALLSTVPAQFAVVAVLCLAARIATHVAYPRYDHEIHLFATHLRIDGLYFGVLLSYLWHVRGLEKKIARIPTWAFFATGAALLSPAFIFGLGQHAWVSIVGVNLFYLGGGAILLGALRTRRSPRRTLRFLSALGAASYSVYLWHLPVNRWGTGLLHIKAGIDSWVVHGIVYIILSFALGWLMNRAIECPSLWLRDRLFPAHRRSRTGRGSWR